MRNGLRIGTSGWLYRPWRGTFYPPGLPAGKELAYLSRVLNSVEINATFYGCPRPAIFRRWRDATPPDFVLAIKGDRHVTHRRRLKNPGPALARFFDSGLLELGPKLGPILWQLPPTLPFKPERLEAFLTMLPRTAGDVAGLLQAHAGPAVERTRIEGPIDVAQPLRHAIEFRHESYLTREFSSLLRRFNVATVIADAAGKLPVTRELSADFVYLRLHGPTEMYTSGYSPAKLDAWATLIKAVRQQYEGDAPIEGDHESTERDCYVYFDNTYTDGLAPANAMGLAARLGLKLTAPAHSLWDHAA